MSKLSPSARRGLRKYSKNALINTLEQMHHERRKNELLIAAMLYRLGGSVHLEKGDFDFPTDGSVEIVPEPKTSSVTLRFVVPSQVPVATTDEPVVSSELAGSSAPISSTSP